MPFKKRFDLNCNCGLVSAAQRTVSDVMKTRDVLCVFEWDTSALAFLSY